MTNLRQAKDICNSLKIDIVLENLHFREKVSQLKQSHLKIGLTNTNKATDKQMRWCLMLMKYRN